MYDATIINIIIRVWCDCDDYDDDAYDATVMMIIIIRLRCDCHDDDDHKPEDPKGQSQEAQMASN